MSCEATPSVVASTSSSHPQDFQGLQELEAEHWDAIQAAGYGHVTGILSVSKLLELGYVMRLDVDGALLACTTADGRAVNVQDVGRRHFERWEEAAAVASATTSPNSASSLACGDHPSSASASSSQSAAASGGSAKECASCGQNKSRRMDFSAAQLKKQTQARCKTCVLAEATELPNGSSTTSSSSSSSSSASSSSLSLAAPPGGLLVLARADVVEETCSICCAALWSDPVHQPIALPPCQHEFHHACLQRAVEHQVKQILAGETPPMNGYGAMGPRGACPLCRHEISPLLWTRCASPYWSLPRHWIPRVVVALQALPSPRRSSSENNSIPTLDRVRQLVLQKADADGIVPLHDLQLQSPALGAVLLQAIREGASRYTKKVSATFHGTFVYYRAPTLYTVLPSDRVWLYRWGPPPAACCALCGSRQHLTPCAKCAAYHLVFYCSDECRQWDEPNHACTRPYS